MYLQFTLCPFPMIASEGNNCCRSGWHNQANQAWNDHPTRLKANIWTFGPVRERA